jgi:hypothetical protein
MSSTSGSRATVIRHKAVSELKEFVVVALYLFICFGALLLFKAAILEREGVSATLSGMAVIKAMILAKFILLGRAMHVGDRHRDRPLIWPTLYKSLAFLVLLAVLTAIEEIVVGLIHGRTVMQSLAELGGGSRDEALVTCLIMYLILLPYFAVGALGEVLGEGRLSRLFFVDRHGNVADGPPRKLPEQAAANLTQG